jgi:anti-anti-sigma factor
MNITDQPFSQETAVDEGILIWRVSGVLNSDRVDDLKGMLNTVLRKQHHNIILDFQGLQAIDSRGLGFLITVQKEVREQGGRLVIVNLGAQFAPLFELTRLNRIFEIFIDIGTAKRSFGPQSTE